MHFLASMTTRYIKCRFTTAVLVTELNYTALH